MIPGWVWLDLYAKKLQTRQYAAAELGRPLRAERTELQACALLDDHATAIHLGYTSYPGQYAFVVLSNEMPPADAAHVLLAATRDDCPNHAADLPSDWQ